MADVREFENWSWDANGNGSIDGNGLNGIVTAEFPLEPGDPASVFFRASTYLGSDGAGGGIFEDVTDGSQMYLSDTTRLDAGSPVPEPQDEPLPLDPDQPDAPVGTDGDDVLIGTPLDDTIEGLAGNDAISGEAGDDLLIGDISQFVNEKAVGGDDVILAGDGNDTVFGDTDQVLGAKMQGGDDTMFGNAGLDTLTGDAAFLQESAIGGNDILVSGDGDPLTFSTLNGDGALFNAAQGGDDLLVGGTGAEIMNGDGEELVGTSQGGDDTLFGAGGNDGLYGDGQRIEDNAIGGNDILASGDNEPSTVSEMFGDGDLYDEAQGGDDRLDGGTGAEIMYGDGVQLLGSSQGGDDTLFGAGGDDTIYGDGERIEDNASGGNDRIQGGQGNDLLFGDADITATDVSTGSDTFVFATGDGIDRIGDFEADNDAIDLAGVADITDFDDLVANHLTTGQSGEAIIDTDEGLSGKNTIALTGYTTAAFSDGTIIADNFIFESEQPDNAEGQSLSEVQGLPADESEGDVSVAQIFEIGGETVYGTHGIDIIGERIASSGVNPSTGTTDDNDQVFGYSGDDWIFSGLGDDVVDGGDGNDSISGGGGDDVISAGIGNDYAVGGHGDDRIFGLDGDDTLEGNDGNDIILGGGGEDVIYGQDFDDLLYGMDDNDYLEGGDGEDVLNGGDGEDVLKGGDGDDLLDAGRDNDSDTMTGGDGSDIFIFSGANGEDVIIDFEDGTDLIDLSEYLVSDVEDFSIEQDGENALISEYGGIGSSITVENIVATDLGNNEFIFSLGG